MINETARATINVCAPVSGVTGCDSSAAVCVQSVSPALTSGGVSWGRASTDSFSFQGGGIVLQYTQGSECDSEMDQKHTTLIRFHCDSESPVSYKSGSPLSVCYLTVSIFILLTAYL